MMNIDNGIQVEIVINKHYEFFDHFEDYQEKSCIRMCRYLATKL